MAVQRSKGWTCFDGSFDGCVVTYKGKIWYWYIVCLTMIVCDWPHWLSYHHCHAALTPGIDQTDRTAQMS
jgi:hypothetical protein